MSHRGGEGSDKNVLHGESLRHSAMNGKREPHVGGKRGKIPAGGFSRASGSLFRARVSAVLSCAINLRPGDVSPMLTDAAEQASRRALPEPESQFGRSLHGELV